ncbi:MAG TPA: hypothetical protein VK534_00125 [Methylomirabilota bacterium]|nr:hypothetical protein [Methylomirabilota bacterium]
MSEKLRPTNHEVFNSEPLTAEVIREKTEFVLQAVYPGFNENGFVTPQLHDDRERLSEEYGEGNVLTSFVIEDSKIKLGLFLRRIAEGE